MYMCMRTSVWPVSDAAAMLTWFQVTSLMSHNYQSWPLPHLHQHTRISFVGLLTKIIKGSFQKKQQKLMHSSGCHFYVTYMLIPGCDECIDSTARALYFFLPKVLVVSCCRHPCSLCVGMTLTVAFTTRSTSSPSLAHCNWWQSPTTQRGWVSEARDILVTRWLMSTRNHSSCLWMGTKSGLWLLMAWGTTTHHKANDKHIMYTAVDITCRLWGDSIRQCGRFLHMHRCLLTGRRLCYSSTASRLTRRRGRKRLFDAERERFIWTL